MKNLFDIFIVYENILFEKTNDVLDNLFQAIFWMLSIILIIPKKGRYNFSVFSKVNDFIFI